MRLTISRRALSIGLAAAFTSACAAPAASPTPAAPGPATAPTGATTAPATKPAAASPPAAAPAAKPAATAGAVAQITESNPKFKELIDAARREGRVILYGVPSAALRQSLPPLFKQRFGVELELTGIDTNEAAQRAIRETAANNLAMDLISGGQTTFAVTLHPHGILEPIRPLLIHDDVNNAAVWLKGQPWFMDAEGRILRLVNAATEALHLNVESVDPTSITASKDLLNPKWSGKISAYDPRVPGPGASAFAIMMRAVGEDFVVKLVNDQQVQFSRDRRQLADWLAQDRHPICIGLNNQEVNRLRADGFKIEDRSLSDVPATLSPTSGMVVLIKNAPHPKAAQLFLNWITTREGMQAYIDAEGYPGTRSDLDLSKLDASNLPKPGREYFDTAEWSYTVNDREQEFRRLAELFKR